MAAFTRIFVLLGCVAGFPGVASPQASIAGLVTDRSGAVLPDVSVEARSPALIEKTRLATTDGSGLYRIENLPAGRYRVVFTRSGLRTHVREGIDLNGSQTATVQAALEVGPLVESITVSAAAPVIDVHNARPETTLTSDVVVAIPTARSYNALITLVPGVVTGANDVVTGAVSTQFPIHGGRSSEGRLLLDGLTIGSPPTGNSPTNYAADVGAMQEIVFTRGGGESETAGLVMNVVTRTGGNATHGFLFASVTGKGLQADNPTPLTRVYDGSIAIGGPVLVDRLWYFVNAHLGGNRRDSASVYYNVNAGDPAKWLYAPDLNRREYSDRTFENVSGRLTWQPSRRHKIAGFWDEQALCRACTGATPGLSEPQQVSPEAVGVLGRPLRVTQVRWSSPATNTLLLEAGYGGTSFGVGNFERSPNPTRDLIRVAEQCASGCGANGGIPGLVYRSQDFSRASTGSYLWKASLAHVTGTHSVKIGYQHTLMTDDRTWLTNDQNLTYRVNNGEPNQLTESISPWMNNARAGWDAVFAQGSWTWRRLTAQAAIRFERATSWYPAQQEGPSRFLPAPIVVPKTSGVSAFTDASPRLGVVFDVFGDGRTALKASLGKYLEGVGTSGIYANANPTLRLPQTTMAFGTAGVTRSWIDANHDFVPDCDLANPNPQDLRSTGADACGVVSNTSFGRNVLTNSFDPAILRGWGVRPSDWNLDVSLEHQLSRKSSIDVAYSRRWYDGFTVVDNQALQPSDLAAFDLVAPRDPRLPGGGGYTISGLYDVVPDKAGRVDNFVTTSDGYGRWTQYFNGVDVTINVRNLAGLTIAAGTSTGQTVTDNCAVRAGLPELNTSATGASPFGPGLVGSTVAPLSPYCHVAYGVLTQFRGLSSYLLPTVDVQVSATFQSKPGAMLAANYAAPNAEVASSLGRNLSGNAPNVTVNLIAPGQVYGDRINQLDFRAAKILKRGRTRTMVAVDFYNVLNSGAVLSYNMTFVPGGPWLQPIAILTPRLIKLAAQFDF